ncbi:MAG TPA: phosphoribosylformylglycinamidine synthase subunit PurS [Nitrospiria bacterium]|jgi:phosphoribosylformylglycinamidine synthase
MKARVYVTLKEGVLDPQGKAIGNALGSLGFKNVKDVRVGKFFEIELVGINASQADSQLKEMCENLLASTVIEDFRFEIIQG